MLLNLKDEPFASGYINCKSNNIAMKVAFGMLRQAIDMPLSIEETWKLAALKHPDQDGRGKQGVFYQFGRGIVVKTKILEDKIRNNPENAEEYSYILRFFDGKGTQQHVLDAFSDLEKLQRDSNAWWGGYWGGHANIDFGMLVHEGTDALRAKADNYKKIHSDVAEWYDAVKVALDAIDVLGERFRIIANNKANECDESKKYIYNRIAKALTVVPKKAAVDFFSAVQSFIIFYSFDGIDSPGAFDQYMVEYFEQSDPDERMEILEGLWEFFHDTRAWNLCIGGSDELWNDKTNTLSYAILEVAAHKYYQTPNLTLRWHRNTSDEFLRAAAKSIATGNGLPALYNDEAVCPALEAQGIPKEDSHLYAMNGCNQIDIQGKSHMGLEDGEICLLKCLEYALFDGIESNLNVFDFNICEEDMEIISDMPITGYSGFYAEDAPAESYK